MIATRSQPEIGGIESHVAEVAGRIAARGYDLELLTTDRSGSLPKRERVDGYLVRRFRAFPAGRDWYFSPGLFWAALRAKYDLVHVQGIHTLVPPLAMIAAILRRTPFLLTFHTGGNSSAFREKARRTQFRILSPLLRRAHTLVGVSVYEARRFEEIMGLPEGAITVIRNGGSLPPVREAVTPEPGLVVSVGRIERYKGHHKAIEALPYLLKTRPEARVEILGAGPYEAELLALAEELGVARPGQHPVHPAGGPRADGGVHRPGRGDDAAQRLRGAPGGRDGGAHGRAAGRGQPYVGAHRARGPRLGGRRRPARQRRRRPPAPSSASSTTRCSRTRRTCPHGRRVWLVWSILMTRSSARLSRDAVQETGMATAVDARAAVPEDAAPSARRLEAVATLLSCVGLLIQVDRLRAGAGTATRPRPSGSGTSASSASWCRSPGCCSPRAGPATSGSAPRWRSA